MADISRSKLIEKAKELIKAQPQAGRREIAKDMRWEYGQALRDSVILSLQREIYPKPVSLIYKRRATLRKEGFTPKEAKEFSTLTFVRVPWFKKVRQERAKEFRQLLKTRTRKLAAKDLKAVVSDRYATEGWELADGKIDPWQMFREMRAEAIKAGIWEETPKRKGSHRRKQKKDGGGMVRLDKGKIKEQRARYQELQRAKRRISPAYLYGLKK